jgi:hypothetical protein
MILWVSFSDFKLIWKEKHKTPDLQRKLLCKFFNGMATGVKPFSCPRCSSGKSFLLLISGLSPNARTARAGPPTPGRQAGTTAWLFFSKAGFTFLCLLNKYYLNCLLFSAVFRVAIFFVEETCYESICLNFPPVHPMASWSVQSPLPICTLNEGQDTT